MTNPYLTEQANADPEQALGKLAAMVDKDSKAVAEKRDFTEKLELSSAPEAILLTVLNAMKEVGKHQEDNGLVQWTVDFGHKMQDVAKSLMERIGPTERDVVAIETDRNLVDSARFSMDVMQNSHEGRDETLNGPVDWQGEFGFLGESLARTYGRMQEAKFADRKGQEFKCQMITQKGLGVMVDVMRRLPEDQATLITVKDDILSNLDVDPNLISDADEPGLKVIAVPGKTRSQMYSSESLSLLIPMGTGEKGHKYVEMTPDMWKKISFNESPTGV